MAMAKVKDTPTTLDILNGNFPAEDLHRFAGLPECPESIRELDSAIQDVIGKSKHIDMLLTQYEITELLQSNSKR